MTNYLSLQEAAEYLKVSPETIKRYVELGQLPTYKLERAMRFKSDDLDNLVTGGIILGPGKRADLSHIVEDEGKQDAWRVILVVREAKEGGLPLSIGNQVSPEFIVHVDAQYLSDSRFPPTRTGAMNFAFKTIKATYDATLVDGEKSVKRINPTVVFYGSTWDKKV